MKTLLLLVFYSITGLSASAQGVLKISSGANMVMSNDAYMVLNNMSIVNNANDASISGAGKLKVTGNTNTATTGSSSNTLNEFIVAVDAGVTFTLNAQLSIKKILTVASGTLASNGYLVLRSDLIGTAQLAALPVDGSGIATSYITGNATIERYIPAKRVWRLLGVPLSSTGAPSINASWQEGVTTASPNPNPYPGYGTHIAGGTVGNGFDQSPTNYASMKYYNNVNNSLASVSNTNIPITSYPGYFLFVNGNRSYNISQGISTPSNTTLRMKGKLATGSLPITVNAYNFTLVGNPYPSAIDFGTLTKTNVANTIYVWDPRMGGNYGLGGYVTGNWNSSMLRYDFTSAISAVSQYIASGEAFFVKSNDNASSGTLTIKESDKTLSGSDQVFGREGMYDPSIRVDLLKLNADSSRSLADGLLVTFDPGNSNNVNIDDAKKMTNSGENISLRRGADLLSIERRNTLVPGDTLFINLQSLKLQSYQLDITALDLSAGDSLLAILKDKLAGSALNNRPLNTGGLSTVNFTVTTDPASYAANRFSIVFEPVAALSFIFKSLTLANKNKDNLLNWDVESEIDISKYAIELSADGMKFTKAGEVPAKGTLNASYNWTDHSVLPGRYFYRVQAIGPNDLTYRSGIVKINIAETKEGPSVQIFPNTISGNNMVLKLSGLVKDTYEANIFSATGQWIQKLTITYAGGTTINNIILAENITAGKYFLRLEGKSPAITTGFIKQ